MALRPPQADQRTPSTDPVIGEAPTPSRSPPPSPSIPSRDQSLAAKPTIPPTKASPTIKRRLIVTAAALSALAFVAHKGWDWWTFGRFAVTTNDAYVQADITIITAKASGYLTAIDIADNQSVKAGDVIVRIDDGDYTLALELAEARVATQKSTVARVDQQLTAAQAGVAQARAGLRSAEADRARAEADFDRQRQLARSDFASRAQLDDARAARDRAVAAVAAAAAALAQAEANVDVVTAQGQEARRLVTELETQARKARRDLSFTQVRAPLDGVLGNVAVRVGAYVEPGKRLAALVPLKSVHIEANLKETQLRDVKAGQPVHVRVDANPEDDFIGRVVSVAPASGSVFSLLPPENATGNFTKVVQRVPVWVSVPPGVADKRWLRPGMSVEVSIDTREDPDQRAAGADSPR